jgi:hypothetical protein
VYGEVLFCYFKLLISAAQSRSPKPCAIPLSKWLLAYQNYGTIMAEEKFEPAGFKMSLGLKDTNLALAAEPVLRRRAPDWYPSALKTF